MKTRFLYDLTLSGSSLLLLLMAPPCAASDDSDKEPQAAGDMTEHQGPRVISTQEALESGDIPAWLVDDTPPLQEAVEAGDIMRLKSLLKRISNLRVRLHAIALKSPA